MRWLITPRVTASTAGSLLALSAVSGCAGQGSVEAANAEAAAARFAASVTTAPQTSCELLAPETLSSLEDSEGPCAGALPKTANASAGPPESVEVYGKDAVVHLRSDTIFLARFAQGWRVTAASCTPKDGQPYDCKIKGS